MKSKDELIAEYLELTGANPDMALDAMVSKVCATGISYEWTKNKDGDYILSAVSDLGFEVPEIKTNFGPDSEPQEEFYEDTPLDIPGSPQGDVKNVPTVIKHLRLLKEILPEEHRDQLLINHETGDNSSAKQILEGFGIDRVIECYAEGMSDEVICQYLQIRPAQLKQWLVASQKRLGMVQRLQDILRSKDINKIIGESFEYEVEEVLDKADAAYQSLKLDCMKMKTKVALDLDARARVKEIDRGDSLPIVNLGIQVNVGEVQEVDEEQAIPVLPTI